jgi:hypothetical protein
LIHEQTSLKIAEREKSARMKALKTGDQACPGTASSAKLHANPDFAILFYKGLTPCHSLFDANLLRCWVPKSAIKWLRWKFLVSVLLINPPAPKVLGRDLPDGTRKRLQIYLGGGIFRPKPPVFDRS